MTTSALTTVLAIAKTVDKHIRCAKQNNQKINHRKYIMAIDTKIFSNYLLQIPKKAIEVVSLLMNFVVW